MRSIDTGETIIGVVAQAPFDKSSSTGAANTFCTLQPIAFDDGQPTEPTQFPNRGLVWWMLVDNARQFARPGQVVSFKLEYAFDYRPDDPQNHQYQAKRDSVKPCTMDEVVEVLEVSVDTLRANDLVNGVSCIVDHPPCPTVLVRWRDDVYGPMRTTVTEQDAQDEYSVSLSTKMVGDRALCISAAVLSSAGRIFEVRIARDSSMRDFSNQTSICRYELVPASAYRSVTHQAKYVRLETDLTALRRVAKDVLGWNRRQRTDLNRLLEQFGRELAERREYSEVGSVGDVLRRARSLLDRNAVLAGELAEAVVESGVLDPEIEEKKQERFNAYIESRAAEATTAVEKRVESVREELEQLAQRRDQLSDKLDAMSRDARAELDAKRAKCDAELDEQRAALDRERENLDQQRQAVERKLETVTDRFVSAREEVINDLLAIEPLLNRAGFVARSGDSPQGSAASVSAPAGRQAFQLRAYIEEPLSSGEVTELEFFERFKIHTKNSGYVYRNKDLAAFHVSVKVSDLTVLGGVSGTGKSSLPRLYAQALAGDLKWDNRYKLVGVNPSWLDVGDLIGRLNALDGSFLPSESGLYEALIHAHEEFRRHKRSSGIYIICLDEMNLAQVEHYFSPFLQTLETPLHERALTCFSPSAASSDNDFREWAVLNLPPTLRFVGTVNFDETTRPLSLRVLDRVNLINLHPGPLGDLDASTDQMAAAVDVAGPPVTHGVFATWRRPGQPGTVAELIDRLRRPLDKLGCPLSPRRYRSLCQFLANAPRELLAPEDALDMQIAQRLVPQIRGLFRREAQEAVEELRSLLGEYGERYEESIRALDELRSADGPIDWEPVE